MLVILVACGGESSSGSEGGVPLDELPTRLATVACDVADECFGGNFEMITGTSDCEGQLENDFADGELGLVQRAIDAGTIDYNANAVEGCLESLQGLGCDLFVRRLSAVCELVLTGSIANGEDCTINAECVPGSFCKSDAACPGTCTQLLAAGQACTDDADCQDGLVCAADTQRCAEPAAAGDACGGGSEPPCPPSLVCKGEAADSPGTCSAFEDVFTAGTGASCDLAAGTFCQFDSRCAVIGATAAGEPQFECRDVASSLGACNLAFPDMCPQGEYCVLAAASLDGTCTVAPEDGEPCGVRSPTDEERFCAPEHVCVGGTCRSMKRLGGPCEGDEECYSDVCVDGGCAPARCADAG